MSKAAWLALALVIAAPAFADVLNMQAGLWEMKPLKTVTDGVDNSAKMSDASSKMQAAMANMTPEQRANMEAMMKQHGVNISPGAGGITVQICVSPEMAKRNGFPVGKDGKCQPTVVQGGSVMSFTYSCQNSGETSTGKGTATRSGDVISIESDGTTSGAGGTHTSHVEAQMRYLGADCGAVKPAESSK